jgi:hypothetical protein
MSIAVIRAYPRASQRATEYHQILTVPISETPTAFVIDGSDPKFNIRDKHGNLYSIDALIKNKVSFYSFQFFSTL